MANVFGMFIFQIVFYFLLTIYLDNVHPGKYGVALSPLYPIKVSKNQLKNFAIVILVSLVLNY